MIIVIMGVSGTGKTTIGGLVAGRLDLPFIEADDFHPRANIEKMKQGTPLTDSDRLPWLQALSDELRSREKGKGAVLACSALREDYRKRLQQGLKQPITWILLEGSEATIKKRMKSRKGHFMPDTLLPSQLATLEKPAYAHSFSIEQDPATIADGIVQLMKNPG